LLIQDGILQGLTRPKDRHFARADLHHLSRLWVAPGPRRPLPHFETAKTDDLNLLSLCKRALDAFQHRIDRASGVLFGKVAPCRNLIDEFRFVQSEPSSNRWYRR